MSEPCPRLLRKPPSDFLKRAWHLVHRPDIFRCLLERSFFGRHVDSQGSRRQASLRQHLRCGPKAFERPWPPGSERRKTGSNVGRLFELEEEAVADSQMLQSALQFASGPPPPQRIPDTPGHMESGDGESRFGRSSGNVKLPTDFTVMNYQ